MNDENMNNEQLQDQNVNGKSPSINFPRANPLSNASHNLAFGLSRGNNLNNQNDSMKHQASNQNDGNNQNMPGMKKGDPKGNQSMPGKEEKLPKSNQNMPGAKKGNSQDNSGLMPGEKKRSENSGKNASSKKENPNIKKPGVRKNTNLLSRVNPLNKIGLGKSKSLEGENGESVTKKISSKVVQAFMKLPLVVRVKVLAVASIVFLFLIGFLLLITLLGGTTGAVIAASCGESTYDVGSKDVTAFLKNMANPMGDANYTVTSFYGWRNCSFHGHEFHPAVDLAAPSGTPIYAVWNGEISEITYNASFGNTITINHNDTFYTMYNHLSKFKSDLKKGDTVKKGDLIGYEGSTGDSTGPHLDFRLFNKDKKSVSVNPYFGYSDKGYENCVDPDSTQLANKCDLSSTGNARKLGDDGFGEISSKTNDYTDSGCCSSYSSSVSVDGVSELPKAITKEFASYAVQMQSKYGVPASLILAQLITESGGNSLSGLATQCKNLFGITGSGAAGKCLFKTQEHYDTWVTTYRNFRKYNDYKESFEDHAALISGDYYKRCTKNAKTADDWARAIKKCGYATDPGYAPKLINVMKTYNLYQYDDSSVFGSGSGTCDSGSNGDVVKRANEEYEKWNKATPTERTEMVKNYMEACGNGRTCNEWCAGFVSYILKETGKLDNLKNYSCMAASYSEVKPATHNKPNSGYTPKAGDIIVFDYEQDGVLDHVAIVESVKGKTIHYIGGNQRSTNSAGCWNNAITKLTMPVNSKTIHEFVTIG